MQNKCSTNDFSILLISEVSDMIPLHPIYEFYLSNWYLAFHMKYVIRFTKQGTDSKLVLL